MTTDLEIVQSDKIRVGIKSPSSGKSVYRPKIAILTNYPYDGTTFTGGVETATAGLLEGLREYCDEFDFHIFALSKDCRRHTIEERDGMSFHFISISDKWFARPHLIPNILNARVQLKKLQPDLVHCQDNMALAIGAMSAQPARKLFTVHGIKSVESSVWEGPEYWSHQMDAQLERWVRRQFDEVVTISPYVDRFLPVRVRKHHIPNPVRNLFFENPQTGIDVQRLLFVGVLTRLKRPMDVIQAFGRLKERYPPAGLSIVGAAEDAMYVEEMKEYIARMHIAGVEFLGARTQQDIANMMRQSTVLVLASVQENSPMAIAEAMASGLPVIASNVGGVPMMIADGVDGLMFECGNIDQLTECMGRVLKERNLRSDLSRNGRQRALQTYSSRAVAGATVNLYRTILGH